MNTQKILVFVFAILIGAGSVLSAPARSPKSIVVTIPEGATLSEVTKQFREEKIVRSRGMLRALATLLGGSGGVKAGDYFFRNRGNVLSVAFRITRGKHGLEALRITVPEGTTISEMKKIFSASLSKFSEEEFEKIAEGKEGYLFPDTYFFLPNTKAGEVVSAMEENFGAKLHPLGTDIMRIGKSVSDIIIMASIIEEEANSTDDRQLISGILWKRIDIGMPLQVDAPFYYILGKGSLELSVDDLKADSPYNTYQNRGLPAGPISNPGLDSIIAAIEPVSSKYLYYLSGKDGKVHYAEDFEGHKENKEKYLW